MNLYLYILLDDDVIAVVILVDFFSSVPGFELTPAENRDGEWNVPKNKTIGSFPEENLISETRSIRLTVRNEKTDRFQSFIDASHCNDIWGRCSWNSIPVNY